MIVIEKPVFGKFPEITKHALFAIMMFLHIYIAFRPVDKGSS